jgi:hypothetical protein
MFKKILLFAATLLLLCQTPLPARANPVDCLQIPVKGEGTNYLHRLELCNTDALPADDDTQVVSADNSKVIISLGLGETLNKTIILQPSNDILEFSVEQSFETSLTIMNEGPHMDLLDWQHHLADWTELPRKNATTFLAHEVSNTTFPAVTTEEIVAAVAEESAKWAREGYDPGERWTTVAKDCKAPDSYPCGISVSKIFLRVMVKIAGQWQQVQLIEFKVPMGC